MAFKLLQIDFPIEGPWGEQMTEAYTELAHTISQTPGLIWKIWTENSNTGEAGGIYLFEDEASLEAYLSEHTVRLRSFGIVQINVKKFDVNQPLTQMTRGVLNPSERG